MNELLSKVYLADKRSMLLATCCLLMVVLMVGCNSSSRVPADNTPLNLIEISCLAFDMNRNTPERFHLPIETHQRYAMGGDEYCQLSLANRYEKGWDAPVDYVQALYWYNKHPSRDLHLGRMAEKGLGQPVDLQQARDHYRKAVELGFTAGNTGLGRLLEPESVSDAQRQEVIDLYFKGVRHYDDDAWKGIQRMLAQGVKPNAEQKKLYAQIWKNGLIGSVENRFKRTEKIMELSKLPEAKESITLSFTFFLNENIPDIQVAESWGLPELDAEVIDLFQNIRMDTIMVFEVQDSYQMPFKIMLR